MTIATASPRNTSSPARTANPKPFLLCERTQRTRGHVAASSSTAMCVPSVDASSTTITS